MVIWCAVFQREGKLWVAPGSVQGLLNEWPALVENSDPLLWNLIPYAMIWSIWIGRNDGIFKDKCVDCQELWEMQDLRIFWWAKGQGLDTAYDFGQFSNNFCKIRFKNRRKNQRLVLWSPPSFGVLKFNVDGASQGNPGPSGAGGILRDHKKEILGLFSLNLGLGGAVDAEAKAILFALKFCHQFMISNPIIESDSQVVVGWFNNKLYRPAQLLNVLNQIDLLRGETHCIEVRFIYR